MPLSHKRPWVIGHRGAPRAAPENTLSSFELAIQQGADLVELDLHLSADKQLIVIHDDTVDRTTDGTGQVGDLSFAELRDLDAGSWMHPKFCGERIPTLAEALELSAGRAGLVVELKGGSDRYPGIERLLARAIATEDRLEDIIVISRNSAAIKRINGINPDVMTLDFGHPPIASPEWFDTKPLSRPGKRFVMGGAREIDRERIKRVGSLGYGVLCSFIYEKWSQQAFKEILASSVDGIFTDHVPDWKRALSRGNSAPAADAT